ncbi:MAG: hypothetical protein H7122_16925 [Chitinophagaceae bacterium]|nr:hypothetical protein [Chitinophagaceae bacterium]
MQDIAMLFYVSMILCGKWTSGPGQKWRIRYTIPEYSAMNGMIYQVWYT